MIKLINDKCEFDSFEINDIYSIRIFSLLEAYGTAYDFARFYRQIDSFGNVTAIISKLDGDYTVSHNEFFDNDELSQFFLTLGYNTVLSDDKFFLNDRFAQGVVMQTAYKAEKHSPYTELDYYPSLMELFNLDDYNSTDFEAWYVDLSHRIRHNTAKACVLKLNDEIVSSAILSSIYNDNAIISAVRTSPEYRRLGYGSTLVSEMICDIKGIVYLMRENGKNESFYKKLGFENTGIWRLYK